MPATSEPAAAPVEQTMAVEKHADKGLAGSKRKDTERPKRSFKVVAQAALAIRKLANSLNPTYTYGKKTASTGSGGIKHATDDKEVASSARPSSPGEHYAYEDRGHKFDFLLKPLPPTEDEEEEA
ncbi:elongation factor G [Micractinium conductrix]|uniref:Elongation factor G n=1 Tax=Micractinium conductrix TaxID=554055 RepID=A0A2P6VA21_9CHLO|nr:elongation factor G [Micractinium conductrix]|eukprot:PSC70942.1 elongation factor G [Micractinium conductrix]